MRLHLLALEDGLLSIEHRLHELDDERLFVFFHFFIGVLAVRHGEQLFEIARLVRLCLLELLEELSGVVLIRESLIILVQDVPWCRDEWHRILIP